MGDTPRRLIGHLSRWGFCRPCTLEFHARMRLAQAGEYELPRLVAALRVHAHPSAKT